MNCYVVALRKRKIQSRGNVTVQVITVFRFIVSCFPPAMHAPDHRSLMTSKRIVVMILTLRFKDSLTSCVASNLKGHEDGWKLRPSGAPETAGN